MRKCIAGMSDWEGGLHQWVWSRNEPDVWMLPLTQLPTASHKRVRYTGELLLGSILASQGLRNKATLRQAVRDKLVPLLPPALRNLLVQMEAQGTLKISQWDSSRQLILDVAAMQVRRRRIAQGPRMIRFGFADSSLQVKGQSSHNTACFMPSPSKKKPQHGDGALKTSALNKIVLEDPPKKVWNWTLLAQPQASKSFDRPCGQEQVFLQI